MDWNEELPKDWEQSSNWACSKGFGTPKVTARDVGATRCRKTGQHRWQDTQPGTAETLGDQDGKLEGPADGANKGPEEVALLKMGLLDGNQEREWATQMASSKAQQMASSKARQMASSKAQQMTQRKGLKKVGCSNWAFLMANRRAVPKDQEMNHEFQRTHPLFQAPIHQRAIGWQRILRGRTATTVIELHPQESGRGLGKLEWKIRLALERKCALQSRKWQGRVVGHSTNVRI